MVVGSPLEKEDRSDGTHILSVSHVHFRAATDTSSASGSHVKVDGPGSDRCTVAKESVQDP